MRGRIYTMEEKMEYITDFKASGKNIADFCRSKNIPETTLRDWLKLEKYDAFGVISLSQSPIETQNSVEKQSMIFAGQNIRIELKEGFDKQFLKKIVEVLIHDMWFTSNGE